MDWSVIIGSVLGGLVGGLFTFLGVFITIKHNEKVNFEKKREEMINNRPRLEIVNNSKEPVKTSYGYHVIYRLDQKKKPSLKKSKDKIVEKLISDKKAKDSNLLYKSLISLRKDKKIKFSDTVMQTKYDAYCKQYK